MSILTDYGTMHFGAPDAWDVVQDEREYLMNHEYSDGEVQTKISDGYYFLYKSIKQTGWKLVYNVKESSISNAHYIVRDAMVLVAIAVAVSAVIIGILSNAVSYSLRELARKVETEDILEHEISVHSYEEITTLSKKLEKMRVHINQLLKQIKEEQDAKQRMEIALLQEQINPHFLYIRYTRSVSYVN